MEFSYFSNPTLPLNIRWSRADQTYFSEETEEDDESVNLIRGSILGEHIQNMHRIGIPHWQRNYIMVSS
ncbi:hypothetical protein Fmac_017979 [Flemingia macrophylla]|uniref:Ycf15 n=1 Tax=Flemingia macrophylla TaxID=520843 RepID=A0ABD1M3M1_9FABA